MNFTLSDANLPIFLDEWHRMRRLARTDLLWLCNEVLGYKDVSVAVHGPILDTLQHFPGARELHASVEDLAAAFSGKVLFEPLCRMETLPWNETWVADRQCLFLYPRGHLKSTIATVAHSIQWILNYPNVRILLTTATEELGKGFVIAIRDHFVKNEMLRQLFPELCPASKDGKVPELGNLSGFTCPGRNNANKALGPGGVEPTLLASTVGSAITGYHGDVFKNDDLVEKINSSSQGGIDDVVRHAGSQGDMLEKYNTDDPDRPLKGWLDDIGTPWDYSDLYQVIRTSEEERKTKGLYPMWNQCIRSAAANWPEGPYLWPQRMGFKALKEIEDDPTKGPAQLSAQYLMNPIVLGQGLIDDIKRLWWMPKTQMESAIAGLTLRARLDLAGMDANAKGNDNDFTALTVAGFGDGTLFVPWMRYGRPPVEDVVEWIFEMFAEFPQIVELVVEKASGASPLESWLRREMSTRGWHPVRFVTRSNQETKKNRIKGLRPWFMDRKIALSEGLSYRTAIENEIKGFPKFRHDDFLDTLSDHMVDVRGMVSGGVITDAVSAPMHSATQDPIALLLARAEMDGFSWQTGFDRDTGFPA